MMTSRFSFFFYYLCLFLVLALLLPLLCFSTQNHLDADVLCLDDERQALLRFKHGLIDETGRLASWVGEENVECCKWVGIVCDNFTGHVREIHLRALEGRCHDHDYITDTKQMQRLGGDINSSLLNLKQLSHLDLSCNDFRGIHVPKFIGSLGNLRYLNLSTSGFGGIIPPQLGNLSKLHVLSLGSFHYPVESTSVMNMRWLTRLHVLQHLDMTGVDLSKAIDLFQVIKTIPSNLVELHLSRCNLSSIHLDVSDLSSHNLTSLSLLNLSYNDFKCYVPQWIFDITSLVSLDLSGCNFHGLNRSSVGFRNLTYLKSLQVSGNGFINSSSVLKELSSSVGSNLISLDISYCGVSSPVLDSLYNLTSLVSLQMNGNDLSKKVPRSLGNLCNLRNIGLSYINFGSINLTYLLESFFECKSPPLESLHISYSQLSGNLPHQLEKLIHLQHLQLRYNHISSAIPDFIGRLSFLRTLDFGGNQISGPIPYSIGRLSLLENLDISSNQLDNNLPVSIGQLSSLKKLDLSHNQLRGSLPDSIGGLSSLNELDISYNQLVGSIPESIGRLSSLETLNLEKNQLDGSLPDSIVRLSSLKTLDLSDNQLNGSLPGSIGRLSSLIWLDFANNLLKGSLGDSFGQLSELYGVDLSNNLLTGVVTEAHFVKLSSLRYLYAAGNDLTLRPRLENWILHVQLVELVLSSWNLGPHFPLWLQGQKGLTHLDISNACIYSPMPHESFWRSLPKLIYLDMSRNRIQGSLLGIPTSLGYVDLSANKLNGKLHHFLCSKHMTQIESLNLGNNNFMGVIPNCWNKGGRHLLFLNFENNNLSGEIPTTLGSLSDLQVLNLHGNKISGRLPTSLMNLTSLTILQLGKNKLVGSMPAWLGTKLTSLRILNLRSNYFDGNISHKLCYLTNIQILVLANNNLSGNIPRCFNNFSVFSGKENATNFQFIAYDPSIYPTVDVAGDSLVMKGREDIYSNNLGMVILLDLSSNNFSGQIPSELTALSKLKSLNLSRNQLTGYIPEKIGALKELESLDLSKNKLFGELPTSLSRLTFLSSFNVSYNNLTGKVPMSTQLQSYHESSFFGNKLCGAPITKSCVEIPNTQDQKEDVTSHGGDWGFIISIMLGFIAGFWVIISPLIVSKSWRVRYFRFLSALLYR